MLELFLCLIAVHALTDFSLQSSWMAKYKSPLEMPAEFAGHKSKWFWIECLFAHSLVNGLGVGIVTNNIYLGILETFAHFTIDLGKCLKFWGVHYDQFLHIVTKILWAYLAIKLI